MVAESPTTVWILCLFMGRGYSLGGNVILTLAHLEITPFGLKKKKTKEVKEVII